MTFNFIPGARLTLWWWDPKDEHVPVHAGTARFEEVWYDDWLEHMLQTDLEVIFFLTVETTDVFKQELNEVYPTHPDSLTYDQLGSFPYTSPLYDPTNTMFIEDPNDP